MAQQKKGLVARLLEGKEKSEEYARSTLPTNRWQLFWDVFKGNFGKIVKVNLLMLIFFVPLLAVLIFNSINMTSMGQIYPFGANVGIGYPAMPELQGVAEYIVLRGHLSMYLAITISALIASVGLSGGMYVIRNMIWTEGVFVANDFWRGVKLNYKNALQASLFFCLVLLLCSSLINFSNFTLAIGAISKTQRVFLYISQVLSYIFIFMSAFMTLWMIALGVNYTMGFFTMFKNAFLITIGTLIQTIFFAACAVLPYLLFLIGGSFFIVVAVFVVILFALAFTLLVWLNFAQWVFDKFINPKIEGAKVGRGLYNKDGTANEDASQSSMEYQRIVLSHGRSRLIARPIKPIDDSLQVYELPQAFTREDLKRLRESKQNIAEDTEAYAEEHKNDLRYVEYNKQFDERERALQDEDVKKGKKRKPKPPKMLGQ